MQDFIHVSLIPDNELLGAFVLYGEIFQLRIRGGRALFSLAWLCNSKMVHALSPVSVKPYY
jgi:hypothetical protein